MNKVKGRARRGPSGMRASFLLGAFVSDAFNDPAEIPAPALEYALEQAVVECPVPAVFLHVRESAIHQTTRLAGVFRNSEDEHTSVVKITVHHLPFFDAMPRALELERNRHRWFRTPFRKRDLNETVDTSSIKSWGRTSEAFHKPRISILELHKHKESPFLS